MRPPPISTGKPGAGPRLPCSFICSSRVGRYGTVWVDVAGELDLAVCSELEWTLRDARARSNLVVLDLRELTFIEITGVRVILDAGFRARRAGRGLLVARGPTQVDAVFTLTGTANDVDFFELDAELCRPALRYGAGGSLAVSGGYWGRHRMRPASQSPAPARW